MMYFMGCETIEDVKARFKELAKRLHPDNGGNAEEFKKMMSEYTIAFNRYKNKHKATNEGQDSNHEGSSTETAEEFAELIEKLLKMEGVKIEIIGSWIWLTGNTYAYRDQIKELRFFWSTTHKAWYYTGEDKKGRQKGRYRKVNDLKKKWGCTDVGNGRDAKKLAG